MLGKKLNIILILFSIKIVAQVNLVPNYSFEDSVACPFGIGQLYNALYWVNPSSSLGSTPDYFNSCNSSSVGVPINTWGFQNAKKGNAYAGFYAFNKGFPNEREYIEIMLSDTLIPNQMYCASFYLNLSDSSAYCTSSIGVYFSNNIVTTATNFIPVTPQLINTSTVLSNKSSWVKLEWQYTALGGERYITIGNFNNGLTSDTIFVGGVFFNSDASYYYIDDVFVGDCATVTTANITIPNIFTPNNDNTNDFFKITSTNITSLNCKIYNRWGILVGELKNVNDIWGGRTTAGLECSEGVYYYVLKAMAEDGKEYNEKGFVSLVR